MQQIDAVSAQTKVFHSHSTAGLDSLTIKLWDQYIWHVEAVEQVSQMVVKVMEVVVQADVTG